MAVSSSFKDHFSSTASDYARFRPSYPSELAVYLSSLPAQPAVAWDCGCGSGHLSVQLALHFDRVEATDASLEQLGKAQQHPRVTYRCARAESCGLATESVDLAVSAQAAHWFDIDAYYSEVRRVTRSGAAIALIAYSRSILDADIAACFDHFYDNVAGPYWPPERDIIQQGYRTLPFPFDEVTAPMFDMQSDWNLAQLLGYVDTWSAMRGLEKVAGRTPYEQFCRDMTAAWGEPARCRRVVWPLSLRVGRL